MHRLQTDIAPTQNKTRSSETKKKKQTEMILHTLIQELVDYMSRWIFKNVTSKQTSFVTNINTVRCPRDAC